MSWTSMVAEILKCVKQHMGIVKKSAQLPNGKDKAEAWDQVAPEANGLISSCVYPSDEKQLNTSGWKLRQMAVQHWLGAEAQFRYYSVRIHFISYSALNE